MNTKHISRSKVVSYQYSFHLIIRCIQLFLKIVRVN